MGLSIGDRVFYTRSTRLRVPAKVVGLLHDGHVELEYDQGGVLVINQRCSTSFGIPSLESPPPSPSIPAIDVPPEVPLDPLVMEAPLVVTPQHDCHHIPKPEASLGNGELGL